MVCNSVNESGFSEVSFVETSKPPNPNVAILNIKTKSDLYNPNVIPYADVNMIKHKIVYILDES